MAGSIFAMAHWWVTQRRRPLRAMQTDSGRNYWVQLKSEKEIALSINKKNAVSLQLFVA
jgi:hypothetical protein